VHAFVIIKVTTIIALRKGEDWVEGVEKIKGEVKITSKI